MSDYVAKFLQESANLEPLPLVVRQWTPWTFWVVILPVTIFLLAVFTI